MEVKIRIPKPITIKKALTYEPGLKRFTLIQSLRMMVLHHYGIKYPEGLLQP